MLTNAHRNPTGRILKDTIRMTETDVKTLVEKHIPYLRRRDDVPHQQAEDLYFVRSPHIVQKKYRGKVQRRRERIQRNRGGNERRVGPYTYSTVKVAAAVAYYACVAKRSRGNIARTKRSQVKPFPNGQIDACVPPEFGAACRDLADALSQIRSELTDDERTLYDAILSGSRKRTPTENVRVHRLRTKIEKRLVMMGFDVVKYRGSERHG
jgi:hypothetical protein